VAIDAPKVGCVVVGRRFRASRRWGRIVFPRRYSAPTGSCTFRWLATGRDEIRDRRRPPQVLGIAVFGGNGLAFGAPEVFERAPGTAQYVAEPSAASLIRISLPAPTVPSLRSRKLEAKIQLMFDHGLHHQVSFDDRRFR
jgi:hypothetical protein